MSMAALQNGHVFSLNRHVARARSERVRSTEEEEEEIHDREDDHDSVVDVDLEQGINEEADPTQDDTNNQSEEQVEEDDEEAVVPHERSTLTLAELEEERELQRRRSSGCVMLGAFVLFRLWFEALQDGDFAILLMALVGTSWLARWIRYNRDREEELDRRIANYLEGSDPGTATVDRNDFRMLSFQAQLALAIMESQRQVMEGGYGHPDGSQQSPGVSDQARSHWSRFSYKEASDAQVKSKKGGYGSVPPEEGGKDEEDHEPHCSICLGEYEEGEGLVKLPCSHVYHDECISSWTSSHTKCPLCNFDLESCADGTTNEDSTSSSSPEDSIV